MNSYGLWPFKKSYRILGFQQIDDTKAQLQCLRVGLACCCGIAAEKQREKEISGFLNERSSDLNSG
jgi:hypothetical protein